MWINTIGVVGGNTYEYALTLCLDAVKKYKKDLKP